MCHPGTNTCHCDPGFESSNLHKHSPRSVPGCDLEVEMDAEVAGRMLGMSFEDGMAST